MKRFLTTIAVIAAFTTASISAKVAGTVNGYKITVKQADKLVKVLTRGKVKYAQLKPKDKVVIIKRLAVDTLVIKSAYRGLSKKERDFVIANAWMAKKTRGIKISNAEAKKAYSKNKALFKRKGKVVPYNKVKNIIKMQLKQKKVVDRLMRKAKIVVK